MKSRKTSVQNNAERIQKSTRKPAKPDRPLDLPVRHILNILIIIAVSAVLEVFLFNFRFFLPRIFKAPDKVYSPSQFSKLENADVRDGDLTLTGSSASFKVESVFTPVYSVRINAAGNYGSYTVQVKYTDDCFRNDPLSAGQWVVFSGVPSSNIIHLITSGNGRTLTFHITNGKNLKIASVEINHENFVFHFGRFFGVCLIGLFFYLLHVYKPWSIRYDRHNRAQRRVFFLLMFFSCAFAVTVLLLNSRPYDFILRRNIVSSSKDSYQLLTDALYHRQLYFVKSPPKILQQLADPYDVSERPKDVIWDSIYYRGKYYSYFGIAPVLTLLLPFKLITGFYLPTTPAVLVFTLIACVALLSLYKHIIDLWFRNINFMAFLFGGSALGFSNLFWVNGQHYFYELAEISALAFFFLGFDRLFAALANSQSGRKAGPPLALAGLFLGLMVASRPNFILYLPAALPLLIPAAFRKKAGRHIHIRRFCLFAAPICSVGIGIACYNYLRFGSPLDFGNEYQLTVSDIRFNKITNFVQAINGIFHYYLQPFTIDLVFPFFHIAARGPSRAIEYSFNFPVAGIFNFPILLILFAAVPIIRNRMRLNPIKKGFVIALMSLSLLVSYLDMTLAGAQMRYTMDIYFTLLVCAVILWMEIIDWQRQRKINEYRTKLFALISAVSSVISCFICLVGESNLFNRYNPAIYQILNRVFEFWI